MTERSGFSASSLTKTYRGRTVVDDVSFEVARGEVFGILGANGAGKTTTVEMLAGIRRPTSGSARVLGIDPVRHRAQVRRVLGVQLQNAYLHYALTVRELITLFRSFYADPRTVDETLDLVQLREQVDVRFQKLSGGQQQRLSVALALVGKPRAVILDEITTGLDPGARRKIWQTIDDLRSDGVTVVLVSHAMDEVERLCDTLIVLDSGRVIARGTPDEVTRASGTETLEDAFLALTGQLSSGGEQA